MRARLALKSAEIDVELREIILRDKPAHMLELSPKGTVPVLELADGTVIDQSLDIMLWALGQNDPQNLGAPSGVDQSEIIALIEQSDGPFKDHLDRTKYSTHYEDEDPIENREKASVFLRELDKRLKNHPYLFGEKLSLADIAIAPFVRQFANIDRDWFGNEPWPDLNAWLNAFLESDLFESVMTKYAPWAEGDTKILLNA